MHVLRRVAAGLQCAIDRAMLTAVHPGHPIRVLLLEPNVGLRRAITEVLTAEEYLVEACESLDQVVAAAVGAHDVALVAWQSMEGLLADEHRPTLRQLTGQLRIVLMVPRRWMRLLDQSDYGFVSMVAKPFGADELLQSLQVAFASDRQPTAQPAD